MSMADDDARAKMSKQQEQIKLQLEDSARKQEIRDRDLQARMNDMVSKLVQIEGSNNQAQIRQLASQVRQTAEDTKKIIQPPTTLQVTVN
jgi:hypothetical protein